jgi:hypothetical protein
VESRMDRIWTSAEGGRVGMRKAGVVQAVGGRQTSWFGRRGLGGARSGPLYTPQRRADAKRRVQSQHPQRTLSHLPDSMNVPLPHLHHLHFLGLPIPTPLGTAKRLAILSSLISEA